MNGQLEGEKILCIFRKISGPYVTAGTGRHRSQRATILGLPAVCIVEKPWGLAK
jgi:hypothetical protein